MLGCLGYLSLAGTNDRGCELFLVLCEARAISSAGSGLSPSISSAIKSSSGLCAFGAIADQHVQIRSFISQRLHIAHIDCIEWTMSR